MTSLHMKVVILACFLSAIATRTTSSPIDGSVSEGVGDDAISRDPDGVAEIVAQVIQRHLGTCQLTLVTSPSDKSPLAVAFVRRLSATFQGHMVIEAKTPLKKSLSGFEETNPTRPCLALLLVAPESSVFTETLAPFLQNSSLFLCPECRVVVTGPRDTALDTLLHPVFRNTKHALYLTPVDTATASTPVCHSGKGPGCATVLQGYSRCLYCWAGQAGMRTLGHWKRNVGFSENHVVFPDKLEDMNGHRIRVVAKELFPFVEHQPHSNASATTVTPKDSLDVRMLDTIASILNFTYEVRMAWDDQWGTLNNGVWSGMVGTLEQERADFSLMLFWSHSRKQVIDFTRIYAYEPFVMITHKPRPLPQHTALVRPFRVELWGAILAATFVLAVSLWAIQRAWSSFSGGRGMNINTAFLHAWAILLEDPPPRLPSNFTGQLLLGWWWVFCFLMTAIYRSHLIAHLSVPITPPPIDNINQLLALRGATWGIEPGFGLGWDWFKLNTNAKILDMFKDLEVLNIDEQLERVLAGRHAFFTWKYYIKTIIASRYTNRYGYTPIHLGRQEFIPGSCGWGVRKGAPFLTAMDRIKDRLAEAGLIDHWLYVLFESKMKKERAQRWSQMASEPANENDPSYVTREVNSGGIVLSLNHLQGAFYLLFLGYAAGLISLLAEAFMNGSFAKSQKP